MTDQEKQSIQTEIDSAYLYRVLSQLEKDARIAAVYARLSDIEDQHRQVFAEKMKARYGSEPELQPSFRAKTLGWLAKKFGAGLILPILMGTEKSVSNAVVANKQEKGMPIRGNENTHYRILETVSKVTASGMEGGSIARLEGRHRAMGGNALRAAVLGANDGLVSNLSLIMGVAGAAPDNHTILIAGFAGLLAGAISMALGEWLSVQSSRELFIRQIEIEKEELETKPEEEVMELSLIYQTKGVPEDQANAIANQILTNKDSALETLAREELGVDPEEMGGSPWEAALTSFVLFAIGAVIPLFPFWFATGSQAIYISLIVSTLGLFGIGSAITLMTGRSVWFSGFRQVLFGLAAAAVTYGIGKLVGVSMAG